MITPSMPSSPQVRCRQIGPADLEAVTDLLTRGFPARSRKYWTRALERLGANRAPPGLPRYGYLLDAGGRVVGVLLLIFSERAGEVWCNVSSWYVEPAYRGQAAALAAMATKLKHVTYLNTSPAAHTRAMLPALGYRLYSEGQLASLPALAPARGQAAPLADCAAQRALPEFELLRAHAAYGCQVLICETSAGLAPFVFLRRRLRWAPLGVAQLVYARSTGGFAEHAGALGRALLKQGVACVLCDADGALDGVPGLYVRSRGARYCKGPGQPAQNDLAFTEMVLFGA
jgi:hypothetical protein